MVIFFLPRRERFKGPVKLNVLSTSTGYVSGFFSGGGANCFSGWRLLWMKTRFTQFFANFNVYFVSKTLFGFND